MRKLFITTTIPASLNFFKGNLKYLSEWYDVCAISSNHEELSKIGKREGVRTHYIPMVRQISLLNDLACLYRFIVLFIKERPYIVHGNTPKASMLSMIAAWLTRVPVRIYMCHGLRYQGAEGKMRKLLMLMERLSCSCATKVICVSNGVRDTFAKDGICSLNKSVVLGYGSASGLDLDYFDPGKVENHLMRQELGISNDDFIYIFIGRIVSDKGINELVHAFDKLSKDNKNVHLVLVGKEETNLNPITENSRTIIERNSRIYAIGRRSDVRPYLLDADAFVFPSHREGFGMVLIEANAMGTPAISSDIIGCNEIIVSGDNGILIPAKDESALYEKMKEWVDNPDLVSEMSQKCRSIIASKYDRNQVWKNYLEEYNRLCKD